MRKAFEKKGPYGIIHIPNRKRMSILQITDIHGDRCEEDNDRTRADIQAMHDRLRPDLLVITGDTWCSDDRPETAPMWRQRFTRFFDSLETPWTLTFGNHDYIGDMPALLSRLNESPYAVIPTGNGRGDFRIEIHENGVPVWDIFLVHSGERWAMPKDLIWSMDEIARLQEQRGRTIPAIFFFHIPLGNYQKAFDEGRMQGLMLEEAAGWGDDENVGASLIQATGAVRACFCGHLHRNDAWFEEKGVLFTFGRSTGHGGYGHDTTPKGGKYIEIDFESGGIDFKTVFADGSEWRE